MTSKCGGEVAATNCTNGTTGRSCYLSGQRCGMWVQTYRARVTSEGSGKDKLRKSKKEALRCRKQCKTRNTCCKISQKSCEKMHKTWWILRKKHVRYTSLIVTISHDNNNHRTSKQSSTSCRSDCSPSCLGGSSHGWVPVKSHCTHGEAVGCSQTLQQHHNVPKKNATQ